MYLTVFPMTVLTFVVLLSLIYPPFYLAETAQISFRPDYRIIGFDIVAFSFVFSSLIFHTQQILFFGEEAQKGKFFIPRIDKKFGKFILTALRILLVSIVASAVFVYLFFRIIAHFFPVPGNLDFYLFAGTVLFTPYFLIRFVLKLPATVAGIAMPLRESWGKMRRIGIPALMFFLMFLFIPTVLFSGISALLQKTAGVTLVVTFLNAVFFI